MLPDHAVSTISCIDFGMKTTKSEEVSTHSFHMQKGHKMRCTVTCYDKKAPLKASRAVVEPDNADVTILKGGSNFTQVGSSTLGQFTLEIFNIGLDDAVNLTVTDIVDDRLCITSLSFPALADGTVITCPDILPPSGTGPQCYPQNITCTFSMLRFRLTATIFMQFAPPAEFNVGDSNIIFNEAMVTSDTPDTQLNNNVNNHTTQVRVIADVRVQIDGPGLVFAGIVDPSLYSMIVCNQGLSNALDVVSTWNFPGVDLMQIVGNVIPLNANDQPTSNPDAGEGFIVISSAPTLSENIFLKFYFLSRKLHSNWSVHHL